MMNKQEQVIKNCNIIVDSVWSSHSKQTVLKYADPWKHIYISSYWVCLMEIMDGTHWFLIMSLWHLLI